MSQNQIEWRRVSSDKFVAPHKAGESFSLSDYRSYLEKWLGSSHPALVNVEEFNLLEDTVEIVTSSFSNTMPAQNTISSISPLEKAAFLKQTIDASGHLYQNQLSPLAWHLPNLLLHPSGVCQWLPLPPVYWKNIEPDNPAGQAIVTFSFELFGLNVPQNQVEWKEMENQWRLSNDESRGFNERFDATPYPTEWIQFLKMCSMCDETFFSSSDFCDIFQFVFYKAWVYSSEVQMALKNNVISSVEYRFLKKLQSFLMLTPEQAQLVEILSKKPDADWTDTENAFKGNLTIMTNTHGNKLKSENKSESVLPFHPQRPCQNPEEHTGREQIVSYAYSRLSTMDNIQSFSIIGFKKEGKTSLMNYIRHPSIISTYLGKNAEAYRFLYMDMETENIQNPKVFFDKFYNKISEVIGIEGLHNYWNDLPKITDHLYKNGQKLVVMWDNFNLVVTNPDFSVGFYEGFRSWFYNDGPVGCVLSSPLQLLELSAPVELLSSPFFNIFDAYHVTPLSEMEATELIRRRVPPDVPERDQHIQLLVSNFGLNPYPLQIAGKAWLENYQKGNTSLDAAIEKGYKACLPYYEDIYSSLKSKQIENIKSIFDPKQKNGRMQMDNLLIDRGWATKAGYEMHISSKQLERFFKEKLGLGKMSVGNKIRSLFGIKS